MVQFRGRSTSLLSFILALFLSVQNGRAESILLDGVFAFICDGESVVILEGEEGWTLQGSQFHEVDKIIRGWRMENRISGAVGYLQQSSGTRSWSLNYLSEDKFDSVPCEDLADILSQTVDSIKEKLAENIDKTQAELAAARQELVRLNYALVDKTSALAESSDEIQELSGSLVDTLIELESSRKEYMELRSLVAGDDLSQARRFLEAQAGRYLDRISNMSSIDRYAEIDESILGKDEVLQKEMLGSCVILLRDKKELSRDCKTALVDLVVAGE